MEQIRHAVLCVTLPGEGGVGQGLTQDRVEYSQTCRGGREGRGVRTLGYRVDTRTQEAE